jgi:hypothetical protein
MKRRKHISLSKVWKKEDLSKGTVQNAIEKYFFKEFL